MHPVKMILKTKVLFLVIKIFFLHLQNERITAYPEGYRAMI